MVLGLQRIHIDASSISHGILHTLVNPSADGSAPFAMCAVFIVYCLALACALSPTACLAIERVRIGLFVCGKCKLLLLVVRCTVAVAFPG